ncbi:MAG: N-acetyltransferase [Woeseiaceae bacterium]|nr:N-acetyltransferase [Woeseiaceae bacterium]
MTIEVRSFEPDDSEAVHDLLAAAFSGDTEARLVERLRADGDVLLELVAVEVGDAVGHVCFSKLVSPAGYVALAPVAVRPDAQRRGIGSALIHRGIETIEERGFDGIVLLGDPAYYRRFGFRVDAAEPLESEYPKAYLQALHFPQAVPFTTGTPLTYAAAFGSI